MKEIDTKSKSNSDGGDTKTDIGTGPPDYTSNLPVIYGRPGSEALAKGDSHADEYYIAEDIGTASGKVPVEVSPIKELTERPGSPHAFTDEVSVPVLADTSGRFHSAPDVDPL